MNLDDEIKKLSNDDNEEYYSGTELDDYLRQENDYKDNDVSDIKNQQFIPIENIDEHRFKNTDHQEDDERMNDGQTNDSQTNDEQMDDEQMDDEQEDDQEILKDQSNVPKKQVRKQRGLPKLIMANQQKYIESLERQKRMMQSKKSKNPQSNNQKIKSSKNKTTITPVMTVTDQTKLRRVNIAGKIKYVPIKQGPEIQEQLIVQKNQDIQNIQKNQDIQNMQKNQDIGIKENQDIGIKENKRADKPVPKIIEKKALEYKMKMQKSKPSNQSKQSIAKSGTRMPHRFAQKVEKNVREKTTKNITNFVDLRRLKAIHDIEPNSKIDANKASIQELRKIKIQQHKQNQADAKKKAESNKRESAIQEILRDEKMSKLSKALAIKKLSVNSRHKTKTPVAMIST